MLPQTTEARKHGTRPLLHPGRHRRFEGQSVLLSINIVARRANSAVLCACRRLPFPPSLWDRRPEAPLAPAAKPRPLSGGSAATIQPSPLHPRLLTAGLTALKRQHKVRRTTTTVAASLFSVASLWPLWQRPLSLDYRHGFRISRQPDPHCFGQFDDTPRPQVRGGGDGDLAARADAPV